MRKLTQTYAWSATQLNALERPKLPPPPDAVQPPRDSSRDITRPGTADAHYSAVADAPSSSPDLRRVRSSQRHGHGSETADPGPMAHPTQETAGGGASSAVPTTSLGIDAVIASPETPHVAANPLGVIPVAEHSVQQTPVLPSPVAPAFGVGRTASSSESPGRRAAGPPAPVRSVAAPPGQQPPSAGPVGQGQTPVTGHSTSSIGRGMPSPTPGRVPGAPHGIVGGRPIAPPPGRSSGTIPRGVVVGGEGTVTQDPLRAPGSTSSPGPRPTTQPGQGPTRTSSAATSGISGGRPLAEKGAGARAIKSPPRSGTPAVISGRNDASRSNDPAGPARTTGQPSGINGARRNRPHNSTLGTGERATRRRPLPDEKPTGSGTTSRLTPTTTDTHRSGNEED